MSWLDVLRLVSWLALLLALAHPLGHYVARVFDGRAVTATRWLGPLERALYAVSGIDATRKMNWKAYALAFLTSQAVGWVVLYTLLRWQAALTFDPKPMPSVTPHLAFDTALSFVTNTNWQSYSGEQTLTHCAQLLGLTVQNFFSAACGMAVLVAFVRGLAGTQRSDLGNFWVDVVRAIVYVLLPLAFVLALALVALGVVQTLAPSVVVSTLDGGAPQTIALGPVASQVAIKQLGTNGGGFFNANSAHPFENPTALTNLLEWLAILLLPAALCTSFGAWVRDQRQGWAVLAAMLVLFVPLACAAMAAESAQPAGLHVAGVAAVPSGNLEGKEVRVGVAESALWAAATTAASNGSVNSMHDSYSPLGGLVAMFSMQLGEVVFGGVGSGLYGMLLFALVAVFVAGLMVGRTPEYLGKKIGAFEIQMASIAILAPCVTVLVGTALACMTQAGRSALQEHGPHGFSEVLYAFSSAANNNGSAFAGLNAATPFYDTLLGLAMWVGRYAVALPALAIAGSLASKKSVPASPGTLSTHSVTFVALWVAVVVLVGALNFVPALALGPLVEHVAES